MRGERAGFTLVEVLVALVVVALGLTALMVAVNGTARTSGYLRDKTLAQWIALNRLSEVRLNVTKFGQNTDTGELDFANRKWHYDTRYFDTSIASMKRVVVRVYVGDAKTKGNPLARPWAFWAARCRRRDPTVDWTAGSRRRPTSPARPSRHAHPARGSPAQRAGAAPRFGTPIMPTHRTTPTPPTNP